MTGSGCCWLNPNLAELIFKTSQENQRTSAVSTRRRSVSISTSGKSKHAFHGVRGTSGFPSQVVVSV